MIPIGVIIDGMVHRVVVFYPGLYRERHETLCGIEYDLRSKRETRRNPVDCALCLAKEHPAR